MNLEGQSNINDRVSTRKDMASKAVSTTRHLRNVGNEEDHRLMICTTSYMHTRYPTHKTSQNNIKPLPAPRSIKQPVSNDFPGPNSGLAGNFI